MDWMIRKVADYLESLPVHKREELAQKPMEELLELIPENQNPLTKDNANLF